MTHILLIEAFQKALRHYVPPYYAGNITLFLTKEMYLKYSPEVARLVADRVDVYEVVGHHENLFITPQIEVLGEQLKRCLDEVAKLYPNADSQMPVSSDTEKAVLESQHQRGGSPPWTSLVPVQPSGSKPPFFYVPPAASTALSAVKYARYLGTDQPVYGLQPLGFEEGEVPHNRVEDMAAYYIKEMRNFQPKGPYYLGGTCFGGFVVFEMAQQLLAQDCSVALLALFDLGDPAAAPTRITRSLNFFEKLAHYAHMTVVHFKRGQLTNAFRWWVKRKITYQGHRIQYVMDAHQAARNNYVLQVYSGKITLFQSSEFRALENGRSDRWFQRWQPWRGRWSEFATGGFECHVIEGKHVEIFEEPRIQILVEQLKVCLDKAQAEASDVHRP
jgi:thioesterase domain-containing protein